MDKSPTDPQIRPQPRSQEDSAANPHRVLILVPNYNDNIQASEIALKISATSPNYCPLIIDDGSSIPLAPDAAGDGGLQVRLPDNLGLGVITHIAFDHALAAGYRAIARIDGDGQHLVSDLPRLVAPIEDDAADLVVGVRVNHQTSWLRSAMKAYFSILANWLSGGRAPKDVNTGFFAANLTAVARLNVFTFERYPEPQIFILACREGLRVVQIEIEQQDRSQGRTTLGLSQALRMFYRFNVFVITEVMRGRRS